MGELLIFGAIAVGSYFFSLYSKQTWKAVAADLGLEYSRKFTGGTVLRGSLRGYGVVIASKSDGQNHKIVAEVHGVDPGFTLGRDSALLRMVKPDIETGDRVFDERTRIEGDAACALAVLGDEARRLTEIVIAGCNGEVKEQVIRAPVSHIRQAESTLEPMLDLAELLYQPLYNDIPVLLAERALNDSTRGVRLQAFRQLCSSFPHTERARSTAELLLETPSAGLRLEACHLLLEADPERRAHAAEVLVNLVSRRHVDSSIRRSALETLADSDFRESATPAMIEILQRPDPEPPVVRRAALEGLVRAGAREVLLEIQPVGAEEAEVLARGLGRLDIAAQPRLLELLEFPEDRVLMAAIDSLRRVGDISCIAALRQVAGKDRMFKSAVARAAEHAIGEIKGRAGGSQRGEISLVAVEPLEGAVSQANDSEAGGEVSLAP